MPSDILRITRGPSEGETIEIGTELHLGRGSEGLGGLGEDPQLSRRHARISRTESGSLQIEDLGSTNGTFLNGKGVTGPQPLRPGDEIALGTTKLTLGSGARETSIAPVVEDPAAGPDMHPTEIRPQVGPAPAERKGPPPASREAGRPRPLGPGRPAACLRCPRSAAAAIQRSTRAGTSACRSWRRCSCWRCWASSPRSCSAAVTTTRRRRRAPTAAPSTGRST